MPEIPPAGMELSVSSNVTVLPKTAVEPETGEVIVADGCAKANPAIASRQRKVVFDIFVSLRKACARI